MLKITNSLDPENYKSANNFVGIINFLSDNTNILQPITKLEVRTIRMITGCNDFNDHYSFRIGYEDNNVVPVFNCYTYADLFYSYFTAGSHAAVVVNIMKKLLPAVPNAYVSMYKQILRYGIINKLMLLNLHLLSDQKLFEFSVLNYSALFVDLNEKGNIEIKTHGSDLLMYLNEFRDYLENHKDKGIIPNSRLDDFVMIFQGFIKKWKANGTNITNEWERGFDQMITLLNDAYIDKSSIEIIINSADNIIDALNEIKRSNMIMFNLIEE